MSGEDEFIRRHFAAWAGPGALGLRDDAALLSPPPGCELVLTTDAIVAGVHFLPDDPPGDIARKALRVNLSDLAAKGADSLGFLLTLALPRGHRDEDIADFAVALRDDAHAFACPLLGGDTVATPGPLMVSITVLGSVPAGRMVPRNGARAGFHLYASGTIGDAALGLLAAQGDARLQNLPAASHEALVARYRCPQPRNALAHALRSHAGAAMDVSDGLAGDIAKLLALGDLGVQVALSDVPLSPAAKSAVDLDHSLWATILSGGDDYELVCAIRPGNSLAFEECAREAGIRVTRLGVVRSQAGVSFNEKGGQAFDLDRLSYSHVQRVN